jgi:hypothetical protein
MALRARRCGAFAARCGGAIDDVCAVRADHLVRPISLETVLRRRWWKRCLRCLTDSLRHLFGNESG